MTEQDIIDICNKLNINYLDGFVTYNSLLIGRRMIFRDNS